MKKFNKKIVGVSLSIILLCFLGFYLYKNHHIFSEITKVSPQYLVPIALLNVIALYINGIMLKQLAIPFKINLQEHFLISLASSFFNLITPLRGGAGLRAIYMKKKHQLNYSHFLSSLFGNYIIIFLVASFTALCTLSFLYIKHHIFNIYLNLIFLGIFLGNLYLIIFKISFKKENFITSKINKVLTGWDQISKSKNLILKLALLTFINILIRTFVNQAAFLGLGIKISVAQAFYLSVINSLAVFINITPGSLGITETLYLVSASVINISPGIALIAALTIRAINTLVLFTLGPIANYILLKKLKSATSQSSA